MENNQLITPTARLFLDAFRAFENALAKGLGEKGFTDITTGNFNILRHLNPDGMHLSALAKDAQISKQAIGKMINDLQNKGYVKLVPDKNDARAKHIHLTPKGGELIDLAISIVYDMEKNYQSLLGKKDYNILRQSTAQISGWHFKEDK